MQSAEFSHFAAERKNKPIHLPWPQSICIANKVAIVILSRDFNIAVAIVLFISIHFVT